MAKSQLVVEFVNAAVTDSITFPNTDGAGTPRTFTFLSGMDGPTAANALVAWWTSEIGLTNYTVTPTGSSVTILAVADGSTWNIGYPTIDDSAGSNINIYYNPVAPCDIAITSVVVVDEINSSGTGSITVNATSSYPIEYRLTFAGAWQSSNVFSGLSSGSYPVFARDESGCIAATNVYIENLPCDISLNVSHTNETGIDLNNGTATAVATSSAGGVEYSLDGAPWQSAGNYTGIAAGVHSIAVRDAAGCTTSKNFTVLEYSEPAEPEECFNPELIISDVNPYKFVLRHCNSSDDTDRLYRDNEKCGVYTPCYFQPLLCTDVLTLQIHYSETEFNTVPVLKIFDFYTQEDLYTVPFTLIESDIYKIEKNVSELPDICGKKVYLEIKSYSTYYEEEYFTHAESEPIDVSNSHDCTELIEYWNDSDYNDTYYTETGYINKFRIEAIFDEEDLPQEMEVYTKSNGELVPVYETIKEVWNLEVGHSPFYIHKKIALALSHQHVRINGREYVKEEPYSFERIPKFALRKGVVKLTAKTYQSKNLIY